jgi:hypothetical protein
MKNLLGLTVQDKLTGFSGVVTGQVEYLTGCNQCLVQPKCKPDGGWVDSQWLDVDRLASTSQPRATLTVEKLGFDKEAPRR